MLLVAGCADGTVMMSDVASTVVLGVLDGHEAMVNHLTTSSNGRWLLSASDDGTVRCWSIARKEVVRHFRMPNNARAMTVCTSADSTKFACGCDDGQVYMFSLQLL